MTLLFPVFSSILTVTASGAVTILAFVAGFTVTVRVIHKENGGLSDARNAGIDAAKGKFLGFVDSDDYVHPRFYELLLQALKEEGADIAG